RGRHFDAANLDVKVGSLAGAVLVSVEFNGQASAVAFLRVHPIARQIKVVGKVETETVTTSGAAADGHFEAGAKAQNRTAGIQVVGDDKDANFAAAGIGQLQTATAADSVNGVNERAAKNRRVGRQAGVEVRGEISRLSAKSRSEDGNGRDEETYSLVRKGFHSLVFHLVAPLGG